MKKEFEGAAPTDTAKAESEPAISDAFRMHDRAAVVSENVYPALQWAAAAAWLRCQTVTRLSPQDRQSLERALSDIEAVLRTDDLARQEEITRAVA